MKRYSALLILNLICCKGLKAVEFVSEEVLPEPKIESMRRYDEVINYPNTNRLSLTNDGKSVVACNTYKVNNTITTGCTFNTYDGASEKLEKKGAPIKFDLSTLRTNNFQSVCRNKQGTVAAVIFASNNQATDETPANIIHKFYDTQTGKEAYPPLVEEYLSCQFASSSRPHLLWVDNKPVYIFSSAYGGLNTSPRQYDICFYSYDDTLKKWIKYHNIIQGTAFVPNGITQHPTKENLIYLYKYGFGSGYTCYDLLNQDIVSSTPIKGNARVVRFDSDNTTLLTTDNRFNSQGYSSDPSYVKLYDITTNQCIQTYGGFKYNGLPAKLVLDVAANKNLVAALSFDGRVYVYDRKTNKQIQKIDISQEAFSWEYQNQYPEGTYLQTYMELSDKEIALLVNTAYYYKRMIGQK